MRRVLRYLEWETATWSTRAEWLNEREIPAATRAGMRVYALKQAAVHRVLRAFFFKQLNVSLNDAAAASLAIDDAEDRSLTALFDKDVTA
ncbi:hypothetical protein B0H16DRAFT_1746367 [Mycena metata]|uniref:Uncharacterized protein n=1 Tax=Mycena metata TaxID=1033252 RepID=A0AAD7MAG8_9AGAR|nr:hypothetical protein B0H16DRAFT_1746367 [Mycena metata]